MFIYIILYLVSLLLGPSMFKKLCVVCILGGLVSTTLTLFAYLTLYSCTYNANKDTTELIGEQIAKSITMDFKWELFAKLVLQFGDDFKERFQENSIIFLESYNHYVFYVNYTMETWSIVHSYPELDSASYDLSLHDDFSQVVESMKSSGESYIISFPRTTNIAPNQPDLLYCTPIKLDGSVVGFVVVGIDTAGLISSTTCLLKFIDDFDVSIELYNFNGGLIIYTSNSNGVDEEFIFEENLFYDVNLKVHFSDPGIQSVWFLYLVATIGLSTTGAVAYFVYRYDQKGHTSKMKTQFLARMTHEIRTPMNGVIGMSDILSEEDGLPETAVECVAVINACSKHLLHLVNNILDLSKIESKKMEVDAKVFKTSLFQEIAHETWLMSRKHNGTKFKVVYENIPVDAEVLGDTLKIQQVICNLVTNSIKFTNEGSITMYVKWDDRSSNTSRGSIIVSISIVDTGIGIPEKGIEQLFQPYTQMSNNNLGQGTGIGLTISKSLAVAMGGSLTCKSKESVGSEFIFRFIVVGQFYQAERAEVERQTSNPHSLSSIDIPTTELMALVVDDNNVNTQVLERVLRKLGIKCETTFSGKQAVAMCERNIYDIIFMDKFMPGQDGILSTREIRRTGLNVDAIIFFCTADVSAESNRECMLAGGTDCIPKPITLAQITNFLLKHGVLSNSNL